MKKEDIEKLKSQIKKGGFPFELEVQRSFVKKNWDVENNTYYIDKDENKGREIDAIASYVKQFEEKNKHYTECTFSLVIEIKKESEKPWVIFSNETTHFEKIMFEFHSDKIYNNFDIRKLHKSFSSHNIKLNNRLGRSFVEGFSSGRDKIFTSLCNVTKAFIHKLESTDKPESSDSILYYFEPLIIIDGNLFEAYLNGRGELEVENREHMQLRFNYISQSYKERINGYIINIITKDYLDEYINIRGKQFDKIFEENKHGVQNNAG